jgi:hypothetical protein
MKECEAMKVRTALQQTTCLFSAQIFPPYMPLPS